MSSSQLYAITTSFPEPPKSSHKAHNGTIHHRDWQRRLFLVGFDNENEIQGLEVAALTLIRHGLLRKTAAGGSEMGQSLMKVRLKIQNSRQWITHEWLYGQVDWFMYDTRRVRRTSQPGA